MDMGKNISHKNENLTIVYDIFNKNDVDNFQIFKILIIAFSIFFFLTFLIILIIFLRRRHYRSNVNNDPINIQSKEVKHKLIEECQLLNKQPDMHNLNISSNILNKDSNKFQLSKSANIRQKPDILLLNLSAQVPDYDSLFDSSPILDQLEDSNSVNQYSSNIQNIYLRQNLFSKSLRLGKLSNKIDNKVDKASFNTKEYNENGNRTKKMNRLLSKPTDVSKSNLKTKSNKTKAISTLQLSEVHEYDVVYVPHNCAASMNNRLDTETSYIRSTWKKRRSILYEEISDVVRRISARLRPDSSHRQSGNSNGSNRASRNLEIKIIQPNESRRSANLSDYNNNINVNRQISTNNSLNGETIYNVNVSASQINNDKLNCNITVPEVPKHAQSEKTPVAPIRTFSINIQNPI